MKAEKDEAIRQIEEEKDKEINLLKHKIYIESLFGE